MGRMLTDDATLLQRCAEGDQQALRELLERHGARVWSAIQSDINPKYQSVLEADDVMQVTYMEAFLQADRITARDTAGFIAWLRRIAQNNLRDAIKELERQKRPNPARRVQRAEGQDSYVTLVAVLGVTTATPSRAVAQEEAAEAVETLLGRLPADYARVIRMYDLEGRDIAEVAAALERSPGAVHMLRARAHDRLRTMLGSETDFFSHAG